MHDNQSSIFHFFKLLIYKHKILKGGLQPLKLSSITVHYAVIIRMRFHRLRADRIYRCSIQ